jgi:hypothetical protein
MLSTALASAISERYPAATLSDGAEDEPVAVFPAIHPAVGAVSVYVEDSEVQIQVGAHTHGHFATYDDPSPESTETRTVAAVLQFLDNLFSNRVVVWSTGGSGGWYPVDTPPVTGFLNPRTARRFLWSGPLKP